MWLLTVYTQEWIKGRQWQQNEKRPAFQLVVFLDYSDLIDEFKIDVKCSPDFNDS